MTQPFCRSASSDFQLHQEPPLSVASRVFLGPASLLVARHILENHIFYTRFSLVRNLVFWPLSAAPLSSTRPALAVVTIDPV